MYRDSSRVALQYENGTKNFHQAVPELHGTENQKISAQLHANFYVLALVRGLAKY